MGRFILAFVLMLVFAFVVFMAVVWDCIVWLAKRVDRWVDNDGWWL